MMDNKKKSGGQVVLWAVIAGAGAAVLSMAIGYLMNKYDQANNTGPMSGLLGTILMSAAPFIGMFAAAVVGFAGRTKPG